VKGKSPLKEAAAESSPVLDQDLLSEMFRKAYTIRRFELRCIELYREGFIRGYLHPYLGEEAIAVGACANGIVGGGIPIATGAALAIKIRKNRQVVLSFFSDGAANNGVFGESLNLAAILDLPVVFILENNHYAVSTPVVYSCRIDNLAERAAGYGIPGTSVDGNDAVAVYLETKRAVARARQGEGPTLIEAKTYRHGGHHVNDPGLYMDPEVMGQWKSRDPVNLLRDKIAHKAKVEAVEKEVELELAEAVEFGKNSPSPSVEEFLKSIEGY